MHPNGSRPTGPVIPTRRYLRSDSDHARPTDSEAAAGIVRSQIDTIYQSQNTAKTPTVAPSHEQADVNPYDRTHQANRTAIQAEQWKRYHSAWQNYYRQYYERYYLGEVYQMRQALEARMKHMAAAPSRPVEEQPPEEKPITDEALYGLRSDLLSKVGASAVKVRRNRHFVPLMAASLTMVVFLFLQYNRILFANVEAYVSPGNIDPANIIIDPTVNVPVSKDPRLIIPKINVDVPVVYDTKPDQASQLEAMKRGVAWFGIPGANSRPGQIGNTVLSGHSSNDLFDPGEYKFIFARLEQLNLGDTFYLNYEGTRYTYNITRREVVRPTDVEKLVYETDKPVVTLITCVPVGTARNRLLITAEQISPNPALAHRASSTTGASSESEALPGNSPTFINRIFRGN